MKLSNEDALIAIGDVLLNANATVRRATGQDDIDFGYDPCDLESGDVKSEDHGIGSFECWGVRGNDVRIGHTCDIIGAFIIEAPNLPKVMMVYRETYNGDEESDVEHEFYVEGNHAKGHIPLADLTDVWSIVCPDDPRPRGKETLEELIGPGSDKLFNEWDKWIVTERRHVDKTIRYGKDY